MFTHNQPTRKCRSVIYSQESPKPVIRFPLTGLYVTKRNILNRLLHWLTFPSRSGLSALLTLVVWYPIKSFIILYQYAEQHDYGNKCLVWKRAILLLSAKICLVGNLCMSSNVPDSNNIKRRDYKRSANLFSWNCGVLNRPANDVSKENEDTNEISLAAVLGNIKPRVYSGVALEGNGEVKGERIAYLQAWIL